MSTSLRLALALIVYLTFLAFVLAQADASLAIWVLRECSEAFHAVGIPPSAATPSRVEFLLNLLMIVPVGLLAALIFPRHPWANWVAYGFVASGMVEVFQALARPLRSAQWIDVVANTGGVLCGVLLARVLVLHRERRRSE